MEKSPLFSEEERAVLQLTEEVTMISNHGVSDVTYNTILKFYSENQLSQILMQIVAINSWNRIVVSTNWVFEPQK